MTGDHLCGGGQEAGRGSDLRQAYRHQRAVADVEAKNTSSRKRPATGTTGTNRHRRQVRGNDEGVRLSPSTRKGMEPHNERDEAGAMSGPALSDQGNGS